MPDLVHDAGFAGAIDSITDAEVLDVDTSTGRDDAAQARPPAPDPAQLERSIRRRRRELLRHMDELERVVRAKLDVRARLHRGSERIARRAGWALDQLVARVRERPLPYLVAGTALLLLLFGGRRGRRYY